MKLLAMDPGARVTGWASFDTTLGKRPVEQLVAAGVIRPPSASRKPLQLHHFLKVMREFLEQRGPFDESIIELPPYAGAYFMPGKDARGRRKRRSVKSVAGTYLWIGGCALILEQLAPPCMMIEARKVPKGHRRLVVEQELATVQRTLVDDTQDIFDVIYLGFDYLDNSRRYTT